MQSFKSLNPLNQVNLLSRIELEGGCPIWTAASSTSVGRCPRRIESSDAETACEREKFNRLNFSALD